MTEKTLSRLNSSGVVGATRIILPPSVKWSDGKSAMVTAWAKDAERHFGRAIHHVDVVPDNSDPEQPFIIKLVFDLRDRG